MRLVDNEIMDRPTHHNTRSLFTASAHPTCIIAIIICRLKCYKGHKNKKTAKGQKGALHILWDLYSQPGLLLPKICCADDFRGGRGCDGHVLQPNCLKKLDMSRYFHNFVYSNAHLRFKNPLVLANQCPNIEFWVKYSRAFTAKSCDPHLYPILTPPPISVQNRKYYSSFSDRMSDYCQKMIERTLRRLNFFIL